jgi:hypothetical protein
MDRLTIVARLQPGKHEVAERLLGQGPRTSATTGLGRR